MREIRRLMVANRGEIAIRIFRASHELGIRTVAIYSQEDRFALHRFKADEAYQVGTPGKPIHSYIDIPDIVQTAVAHKIDAIHPGYGFLSENADFARACASAGIAFVGPRPEILDSLGDKVAAREIAAKAKVPIISGSDEPAADLAAARAVVEKLGLPVILKAAHGGGGRGMRVIRKLEELAPMLEAAQREAKQAFGNGDVFIEKYIQRARHLEVQLLGDQHGNLIHLYERDCSIQRRHQKVCEIAPAPTLRPEQREELCQAALAIGRAVQFDNAGTVEFLYDEDTTRFYFIEVNPRIQVEHTVTEAVTGIDIVKRQILIASGHALTDPEVGLASQSDVRVHGFAIQCRVTTEDPANDFVPDHGKILHYRSAGGMGIRLDAGTAFSGAIVTPYFDSLLVKVTAWGHRYPTAAIRMERALQEFRIRGVKTNIPFLLNLVKNGDFLEGKFSTRFLDENPDLFQFRPRKDRATKLLSYLADVTINGHPQVSAKPKGMRRSPVPVPDVEGLPIPDGTKQILDRSGPQGLAKWTLEQKELLLTDTTLRDAHQSLLATRMRAYDMIKIADAYARRHANLFSLEMWGGATFDTAMRFLGESPWQRLDDLRERIPNILFQMLFRASNAVGYTTYPDNVVRAFVLEAAQAGIDIFRIFDSLNWVPNMKVAMDSVLETGKVCEAAICYTGDILNPKRPKYDLAYYVNLAKQLEKMGAHFLAIKDMSGLCKPAAAAKLVKTLKGEIGIPIHFHTHDTAGIQAAAILNAAEVGLDVADAAFAPMSGTTSQPNLNSLVEALRFTDRQSSLDLPLLNETAGYWEKVRDFYQPFESDMRTSTAEVYTAEIPGGQYTNLYHQAKSVGLGERFRDVCLMYAEVNQLFGDIVKVTPSSKVVGDMAIYMVSSNLTPADVLDPNREIAFPASVVGMLRGELGQPDGGWPAAIRDKVLRGATPIEGRPGVDLPPADLEQAAAEVAKLMGHEPAHSDVLSYLLYPKVFTEFVALQDRFSDPSVLPTPLYFYGLEAGEETVIDIEPGKTLIIKLTAISEPDEEGNRTIFFELNGQPREVTVVDKKFGKAEAVHQKADPSNPKQVGSPMPGLVTAIAVREGDRVRRGDKLATIEAMKMETTVYAEVDGLVASVIAKAGTQLKAGDMILRLE